MHKAKTESVQYKSDRYCRFVIFNCVCVYWPNKLLHAVMTNTTATTTTTITIIIIIDAITTTR